MTQFTTPIVLGKKYLDRRTGIEGYAEHIEFMENGCVEVMLEFMDEKNERKHEWFNELRLEYRGPSDDGVSLAPPEPETHITDIVLGDEYFDAKGGLQGVASSVIFSENMATRVNLRSVSKDKKTRKQTMQYFQIDDFLLTHKETKVPAKRTDDKRSPGAVVVSPRTI